jgi:hypothetical protein
MRRAPLYLALLLATAMTQAADFPDPAKLPSRPELPDPLVLPDGGRITTKEQWAKQGRPAWKELFQHYMFGRMPKPLPVTGQVRHEDRKAFGGKATLREIALAVGPADVPPIFLLLVVPNERKGPAPVFVGLNFCGNHALVDDPQVRVPTAWMYPGHPGVKDNRATEAGRGKEKDVWALEQSIDRGYAVATFYDGDVDPDRADKREGLRPFLAAHIGGAEAGAETATIAAWAWGVSRAVDYLSKDRDLDARRIVCVGHSRLGKTALLAAAFDERIALAIPHQAGCGGTAPSRCHNPEAETVKRINTSFPHWFCGNFKKVNDDPSKLPFDQDCLVALCAPRPVLFTNAVKDQWANPAGQFEVLQAAEPVYKLLGAGGLASGRMPPPGKLSDGTLGYYIREGTHAMTKDDWKVFLAYADKHLGKPDRR